MSGVCDLHEGSKTISHSCSLHFNGSISGRVTAVHVAWIVADQLSCLEHEKKGFLDSDALLCLDCGTCAGPWDGDVLNPYTDDDDAEAKNLADVSVDSQNDFCTSFLQLFDTIQDFCRFLNGSGPEDAEGVFRLATQSLSAVTDGNFSVAVKAAAL